MDTRLAAPGPSRHCCALTEARPPHLDIGDAPLLQTRVGRLVHDGRGDLLLERRRLRQEIAFVDHASCQGSIVVRPTARSDVDPYARQTTGDSVIVDPVAPANLSQRFDDTIQAQMRFIFQLPTQTPSMIRLVDIRSNSLSARAGFHATAPA